MTFQSPVPLGATFAGKYRVDRVIGEGGMGIVVAAHHLELDQTVAIKFLLDDVARNAEGAERFRREARAAAKIQSDHVVRVLDVGLLDSGERYMVMEYLDGHDLAEELRLRGQLPIDIAVRHVLEALDAIGQAHAANIVHRDLKPANLYLAQRADGIRRIKVLDFGISKSMGITTSEQLSLTRTSAWIGSPLYMAPEQMQSARDVDARADLWSLGAILYELLSGQPPYPAESLPQLCNLLLTTDVQPLCELRSDVPSNLNDVVMRCLARPVEQRWQTAAELSAALARACPLALGSGRGTMPSSLAVPISVEQTSLQAPSVGPHQQKRAPEAVAAGTMQSMQPAVLEPHTQASRTTASWGRTGEGNESPGRFKLWLGLGAAVAAAGLAFVFLGAPRSEPTLDGANAEPQGAKPESVSTTPPSSAARPTAEGTSVPPTSAAPAEPSVEAPPAEAPSPSSSAAAVDSAAVQQPAKPTKQRAPVRTMVTKPTTKPAAPASDGISDFGGRR